MFHHDVLETPKSTFNLKVLAYDCLQKLSPWGMGLLLVIVQLLLAWRFSPHSGAVNAYNGLFQWDSLHYEAFLIKELHVGFFPGYPLLCQAVLYCFPWLGTHLCMLLSAQFLAVAFWGLLLTILKKIGLSPFDRCLSILFVFFFPGAFFLIEAYSEALFCFALLMFLYYAFNLADIHIQKNSGFSTLGAAAFGFVVSITRLMGLPAIASPLGVELWHVIKTSSLRPHWKRSVLISFISACGCLSFFAYCHFKYNHWNAYMLVQQKYWGHVPNYFVLFYPSAWFFNFSSRHHFFAVVFNYSILIAAIKLLTNKNQWSPRWQAQLGLLLTAALMHFTNLVSTYSGDYKGIIRYDFPVAVCLLLFWALHLTQHTNPKIKVFRASIALFIIMEFPLYVVQLKSFIGGHLVG